jgi:hypothetical protein
LRERSLQAVGAHAPRELAREACGRDRPIGAPTGIGHRPHAAKVDALAARADEDARATTAHPDGSVGFGDRAAGSPDADHDAARLERIEVALVAERREQCRVRERGGDLRR